MVGLAAADGPAGFLTEPFCPPLALVTPAIKLVIVSFLYGEGDFFSGRGDKVTDFSTVITF